MFIDADVRLCADALARMAASCGSPEAALASGVPRQELGTFSERLLIPLIHFILLGFLPMHAMRRTRWPSMSAGCGQLFIARRDAYEQCGGHAMLRDSLHDGLKLPRVFRRAGFRTDLFDATDLATCRMYHTNGETWRGLGKNATEGLAAPGTIVPMTALLLGGQVLPFVLLAFAPMLSASAVVSSAIAATLAYLPRLIGRDAFDNRSAARCCIRWACSLAADSMARARSPSRRQTRGVEGSQLRRDNIQRTRQSHMKAAARILRPPAALALAAALLILGRALAGEAGALPTNAPARIELRDQFDTPQTLAFPTTNVTVLTIADKKGSEQVDGWIAALKPNYAGRVELRGLADVGGAPGFVQDRIRKKFQETRKHPVMMDWSGKVCAQFGYKKDVANILVLGRDGVIHARFAGATNGAVLAKAHAALDQALALPTKVSPGSVPGSRAP